MRKQTKISVIFWSMVVVLLLATGPTFASAQQATAAAVDNDAATEPAAPATNNEEEKGSSEDSGTALPMQAADALGTVWGTVRSEGQIAVGIRAVSQNGSETRYAKDIDLDSGVRIVDTHWVLSPANRGADTWYDRIVFDVNGAYGDPNEYYGAQVYKTGKYRFNARTRKNVYKWAVTGDHNIWDTTRWYTDVALSVNATKALELYTNFNHLSQSGDSIRTVDISRNEFEIDVPIDSRAQTWVVGARYSRSNTSFFVQQEQYSFKNNVPRDTQNNTGLSPDEAEINFFSEQEVQAIDAPATTGGISTTLLDNRVNLNADFRYSKQRLAFAWDSYWDGLNFRRQPTSAIEGALGSGTREVLHGNFFAGFAVNGAASLTARYRYRSWDQDAFNQTTVAEEQSGSGFQTFDRYMTDYQITDNQFLVGAKGNFGAGSVYGEVGVSSRDQAFDNDAFEAAADTQSLALRLGGTLRPSRMADLKVSYDYGDIDDPFTRISPTKVNKFRIRFNSRPALGLLIGAHYTYRKVENTVSDFDFEQNGFGFTTTYNFGMRSFFNVSYTRQKIDQQIPITFWLSFAGPTTTTAMQDLANNVFVVAADVTVSQNVPLAFYGSASAVSSDADELGFTTTAAPGAVVALNYYDVIAGVRYTFDTGLFFDAQGRFIDYKDDNVFVNGADNYDAGIFTAAVGFRFD